MIYRPLINPEASDHQVIRYSKVLIVIITIVAILLVWRPVIPIAELTVFGFSTSALMIFPLVGGYYWKRATTAGALASLLIGVPCNYILSISLGWPKTMLMAKPELLGLSPFLASLLITGSVFILVSFFTKSSPEQVLRLFHAVE